MVRRPAAMSPINGPKGAQGTICLALVVVHLASATASLAEIAPQYRRRAQDSAPEAVMIRVTRLGETCSGQDCSFDVDAEILCVLRSATGLRRGDTARIKYRSNFELLGSTVPRVSHGGVYPAFLAHKEANRWLDWWTGRYYVPAAASASFSPFIDLSGNTLANNAPICRN